jgi:hypothetical protein
MYLSTNNNKKAIGQGLLAALLTFSSPLFSDQPEAGTSSSAIDLSSPEGVIAVKLTESDKELQSSWTSSDQKLTLYLSASGEGNRVCPQTTDAQRQPFCRQFSDPVRNICGDIDHVYLVLANGDLHLVNNALIGVNGDFNATFHSDFPVNLRSAWFTEEETCQGISLPKILGMNEKGTLLMFDGKKWQKVNEVSHLAPSP